MPLVSGTRIGPYQVTAPLGAGGMGQVYRARDTRLNRDVAIKVISEGFAADPERLARFTREAHTLAALNHPHIAHVYGIEESGEVRALVMELVDGEDLADRIRRGKPPVGESLRIAQQIAEAVEAAHDRGIVHRDLKPSNIMLDRDGRVRVLDFGLATSADPIQSDDSAATITSPAKLTGHGVIVGTPAYMSPEQITGQPADKRSDVWSFGCVLYELLTGRRAFDGGDSHDAMMAIAAKEPDWSALGSDVPNSVKTLLRRCLDKNRRRRLSDMSAARLELEEAGDAPLSGTQVLPVKPAGPSRRVAAYLPWAITALSIATAMYGLLRGEPRSTLREMTQVVADVGAPVSLLTIPGVAAVVSPDGRLLVFAAQPRTESAVSHLYLRTLDELSAVPIPGTEGASNQFFSPDGKSLGFFANAKLKKIAIGGGAAIELADAPNGRGGSWGDDGHIVFMPDFYSGIWRVPAAGGEPKQLTRPATAAGTHRWPQVLPGSKAIVYTSNTTITGYDGAEIVLQPLPSGTPRVIQKNAMYGRYLESGHLVFMRRGALFAAGFDLATLERSTEPVPLLDDVAGGPLWTAVAQFSSSTEGTAAYIAGKYLANALSVVTDTGAISTIRQDVVNWSGPSFSRDGRRLALDIFDGKQSDIWIYDLTDGTLSRLTQDPNVDAKPIWSPDGKRLIFGKVLDDGTWSIVWHNADGSGETRILMTVPNASVASSIHPSGRFVAYVEVSPATSFDVKILPIDEDETGGWKAGTPIPVAVSAAVELEPTFSPDGRWLAYSSTVSGRPEVYVRSFPGPGGTWQVSNGGGGYPTWSQARNELLYSTLDQRIMAVQYTTPGSSFRTSTPRLWTSVRHRILGPSIVRSFNLHPDGRRLVFAKVAEPAETSSDPFVMVFNLFDRLNSLLPSR